MAASQRPGELTYYDELGVESGASPDEIRDAFRALARLLHPDAQTDPALKDMAERQMRKLNRIHAVLADPTRRSAYDDSLASARHAPIIVFSGSDGNLKKLLVRLGIAGAIIFGTFLLIWFAVGSNTSTEVRGQDSRVSAATRATDSIEGDPAEQIARLRARILTLETERNSVLAQLSRVGIKPSFAAPAPSQSAPAPAAATLARNTAPAATTLAELPSDTKSAAPEPPVAAAQFTGFWVNGKAGTGSASPGGKAQYPPEFIELTVTEQNGVLHGQYHSRYQILDHAISPDVDFVFSGTPGGSSLNCAWQGPGGSKGRMTLKLLPAGAVDLAWNATELGTQQWLTSGAATLNRR